MEYLVIYDSKYGSTRKIAQTIGQVLGGNVVPVEAVKGLDADLIVLGCPIYAGRLLPRMIDFLTKEKEILQSKKLAVFIVCGDKGTVNVQGQETGGKAYLKEINQFLGGSILAQEAFIGRMKKSELDQEDQAVLEDFSNILGVKFPDFEGMDLQEAKEFGEKVKELAEKE